MNESTVQVNLGVHGLGVHLAFLHLIEVDQYGPEAPLDFRTNFLQTWLAISLIGSLSISLGDTFYLTALQVCATSKSPLKNARIS